MDLIYVPEIVVQHTNYLVDRNEKKVNTANIEDILDRFEHYSAVLLPRIWKEVLPDFLKKSRYFSFSLYDEFIKDNKELLLSLGLEVTDPKELKEILPLTAKISDYMRSSEFDDWNAPHPENPYLYDANKEILVSTITHEHVLELRMSEDEKNRYEKTYQIKFIPSPYVTSP